MRRKEPLKYILILSGVYTLYFAIFGPQGKLFVYVTVLCAMTVIALAANALGILSGED